MSTDPASIFAVADDGVDPKSVPYKTLYTGAKIPTLGLGTFGSDRYTPEVVADAVIGAASVGYRHFDCASVYGNERQIGHSLQTILKGGLPRDEFWVTSKVWNDKHGEGDVIASCKQSLSALQLDYLDLYLVHWPFPNAHAPGCSVDARNPNAKAYIHEDYMKTWRQMEQLVEMGLVKHIGTSNMTIPKLKLVLRDAKFKPACNELELHPHFQQKELLEFVVRNGIVPIAYSPIGSPSRPERDRTADDSVDIEDPIIVKIAQRLNIHPAVVCVKWAIQSGAVPIPFSVKRPQYLSTLRACVSEPLTDPDMTEIARIDRGCRLIKGQVFLWKDGQTWEDLWDLDGEITPP